MLSRVTARERGGWGWVGGDGWVERWERWERQESRVARGERIILGEGIGQRESTSERRAEAEEGKRQLEEGRGSQ